ncbi:glycosyl hydrolase family 28-related protein [Pontiella sulfatireligans]|uniref:Rhamnogalacturonase A/B/Epimerase-like pectate lyase domain-containing protein n=1 Tax=Pontiella sulfatireligans TaxID=2750658 RepID=A0A6C2URX8_9BACT|nr:glycosyl hydrolase family 28-related protein [Pontiella sulfatireligans]VGO21977.1 hypothetical protein SCARR_04057 [Pontiella sulfatireligans]
MGNRIWLAVGAAVLMSGLSACANGIEPRLVVPTLNDADGIVADVVVTDAPYSADATGKRDCTASVQKAIDDLSKTGGGVVYIPAGKYRFDGCLKIPGGIALRGDWKSPLAGGSGKGTILMVYSGRGNVDGEPFIRTTGGCSGLQGLSFWYPEQTVDNIVPYPPTVERNFIPLMLKNLTFYNSYWGHRIDQNGGATLYENIYGTFLNVGIENDLNYEYGFIDRIYISPSIWADAPREVITNAPKNRAPLVKHCKANTIGLRLLKNDNLQLYDIEVADAHTGILFDKSPKTGKGGYGFEMKIKATENRRFIDPWVGDSLQVDRFPETADCFYEWAPIRCAARKDVLINVRKARWGAKADGKTDDTESIQKALDEAGKKGGGTVYLPGGTYAVKSHLLVPPGVELRGGYDYPHHGSPGDTAVSVLLATAGADSKTLEAEPPFITLKEGAGVRGVMVFYPEQSEMYPDSTVNPPKAYPWTIRGEGQNVYVKYVTIKRGWNGIDLWNHDCSGFVLQGIWASPLNIGVRIGGGTDGGWIQQMIQTMGVWHFPGRSTPQLKEGDAPFNPDGDDQGNWFWNTLSEIFLSNSKGYLFGDVRNIQTFGAISFRLNRHMLFQSRNGSGPQNMDLYLSHSEDVGDIGCRFEAGDRIRFFGYGTVAHKTGKLMETTDDFSGTVDYCGLMFWGAPPGGVPVVRGGTVNIHPLTPEGTTTASVSPGSSKGLIKQMSAFKQHPFDRVKRMNGKKCWLIDLCTHLEDVYTIDLLVDYDTFRFGRTTEFEFAIEYMDRGEGILEVFYDALGNPREALEPIELANTGKWKTVRLPISNARFARSSETYPRNTDIRIEIKSTEQPAIAAMVIRKK